MRLGSAGTFRAPTLELSVSYKVWPLLAGSERITNQGADVAAGTALATLPH
jgi:hypothetical protein